VPGEDAFDRELPTREPFVRLAASVEPGKVAADRHEVAEVVVGIADGDVLEVSAGGDSGCNDRFLTLAQRGRPGAPELPLGADESGADRAL